MEQNINKRACVRLEFNSDEHVFFVYSGDMCGLGFVSGFTHPLVYPPLVNFFSSPLVRLCLSRTIFVIYFPPRLARTWTPPPPRLESVKLRSLCSLQNAPSDPAPLRVSDAYKTSLNITTSFAMTVL
jgi:hypothetical protein